MATAFASTVYYSHEKWTRLRVLGWTKDFNGDIAAEANLIFTPLKQNAPAANEDTNPEMADPQVRQFIADHNTILTLCELPNPWYFCNMLQVAPAILGGHIKYLLRCSNYSYPGLLVETPSAPDLYINKDEKLRRLEKLPGNQDILEIQAYDDQIVIIGGPIGHKAYWPDGYPVKEQKDTTVYVREDTTYNVKDKWWLGEDIILPITAGDEHLGKFLLRVWAGYKFFPFPPPPEFADFWQRISG